MTVHTRLATETAINVDAISRNFAQILEECAVYVARDMPNIHGKILALTNTKDVLKRKVPNFEVTPEDVLINLFRQHILSELHDVFVICT